MQTELTKLCVFPLSFLRISRASFLSFGFERSSPLKSTTLSAPNTYLSLILLLIFTDLSSARFLEISVGFAPSSNNATFIEASSISAGIT